MRSVSREMSNEIKELLSLQRSIISIDFQKIVKVLRVSKGEQEGNFIVKDFAQVHD